MKKRRFLTFVVLLGLLSSVSTTLGQSVPSVSRIYQQSYEEEAKGNYQEAIFVLTQASRAGDNGYLYHLRLGWLQYLAGSISPNFASIESFPRIAAFR